MRTIKRCINKRMIDLCKQAMKLEILDEKIRLFLPPELHAVCKATSFNQGCLILSTPEAIWATPLYFLKSDLRDFLRKEKGFTNLSSITVKVSPNPISYSINPKKKTRVLSADAKRCILELAEVSQIPSLKTALLKLAQRDA